MWYRFQVTVSIGMRLIIPLDFIRCWNDPRAWLLWKNNASDAKQRIWSGHVITLKTLINNLRTTLTTNIALWDLSVAESFIVFYSAYIETKGTGGLDLLFMELFWAQTCGGTKERFLYCGARSLFFSHRNWQTTFCPHLKIWATDSMSVHLIPIFKHRIDDRCIHIQNMLAFVITMIRNIEICMSWYFQFLT